MATLKQVAKPFQVNTAGLYEALSERFELVFLDSLVLSDVAGDEALARLFPGGPYYKWWDARQVRLR